MRWGVWSIFLMYYFSHPVFIYSVIRFWSYVPASNFPKNKKLDLNSGNFLLVGSSPGRLSVFWATTFFGQIEGQNKFDWNLIVHFILALTYACKEFWIKFYFRMLQHSLGGAVIFLSLQHFIAHALDKMTVWVWAPCSTHPYIFDQTSTHAQAMAN